MTRKELANELFRIMKRDLGGIRSEKEIWQAIAETDDNTCLHELLERRERE